MIFDDIKEKLDITEYIGRFVQLKSSGRNFKACCPFHQENTPSFIVNSERQTWRCFGACNEGGDVFDFAMRYHGWDLTTAITTFANQLGIPIPERGKHNSTLDSHYAAMTVIADTFHKFLTTHKLGQPALDYLKGRGVTEQSILDFQLGFCPPRVLNAILQRYALDAKVVNALGLKSEGGYELLQNRLVFPIRDHRGRACAFGGRSMDGREPKYINSADSPIFHKYATLYNLDKAQFEARKQGRVVVVEGYMDAVSAVQNGHANTVAQMGTALTPDQFGRMKFIKQILLATDGDNAGLKSARRSAENGIMIGCDVRVVLLPNGEDPDSLIRKNPTQFQTLLEKPHLAEDFLIEMIKRDMPAEASVQERETAARSFAAVVAKSANVIQQHWHIQKLANALKLPEAPLLALLKSPTSQPPARQPAPVPIPVTALDMETQLAYALGNKPQRCYEINRVLIHYHVDTLLPSHFSSSFCRDIFRLVLESLNQDEEDFDVYVKTRTATEIPDSDTEDDLQMLIYCAKQLLLRRIDEQIDHDQQDVTRLISERARLLALP